MTVRPIIVKLGGFMGARGVWEIWGQSQDFYEGEDKYLDCLEVHWEKKCDLSCDWFGILDLLVNLKKKTLIWWFAK